MVVNEQCRKRHAATRDDVASNVIDTHEQVAISKSGREGRQLRRPERGLSLSGANITMSYQADQLRCFTENQLSRLAGTDFLVVFRNADCKRVDVSAKLRLAIPRHLQPAVAPRQSKSLLARGQRCGADRIVNAALRRTFAAAFGSHWAALGKA